MLEIDERGPVTRLHLGRSPLGHRLRTVSLYRVGDLLIDSGPPATAGELLTALRARPVHVVFNTHHHEDHAGGNTVLHRGLGARVVASAEAVAILAHFPRIELYRRVVWGKPESFAATVAGNTIETDHYRFEVVPTPGHSPDHVCLFEPREGWLFTGDLFIHERVSYLRQDEDMPRLIASLHRAARLRPRVLFCAHAGIIEDPTAALRRKLTYWRELCARAHRLAEAGLSLRAITKEALGPEGPLTYITRGHFSRLNLVRGLLQIGPEQLVLSGDGPTAQRR